MTRSTARSRSRSSIAITRSAAHARPVVGADAVGVDEHDVADDRVGPEHVHLDVEAEHVELVREPFDPAAVPEPDARAFVERENDLHVDIRCPSRPCPR